MFIWFPDKMPEPVLVGIRHPELSAQILIAQYLNNHLRRRRNFIRIPHTIPTALLKTVSWTPDSTTTTVEHVCIDHRRLYILMSQQLLNRADIITVL